MEKTILGLFVLVLSLTFTAAFASPAEFQNKELNAKLADGRQIHFQFTDEPYPMIDNGRIAANSEFSLADTSLRIYQNGFLITMPEQGWFMSGSRIKDNSYAVKMHEWNGATFLKTQFIALLDDIKTEQEQQPISTTERSYAGMLVEPEPKKDLVVLVQQSMRNYWDDNYQIFVKVFDRAQNPNPSFDDFGGTVDDAKITVTLTNPAANTKYTLSGTSKNNGYWHGSQYMAENVSPAGKYLVDVTAKYGESTKKASEEMFLFAVAANRISTGNSTAP